MTELGALRDLKNGSQDALAWFIRKYGAFVSTIVANIMEANMTIAVSKELLSSR